MEICDRRRCHRGSRDESRLTIDAHRILKSSRTRSVLADPGGRIAYPYGLKSRSTEWSRPTEPCPPQAGDWCSRHERRPNVRLIWRGKNQVVEAGSDLGYRNSYWRIIHARLNSIPCPETSHVRGTVATRRKIQAASLSLGKSAASSAPSNANCDVDRQSSP
jgi:hypothetical protein